MLKYALTPAFCGCLLLLCGCETVREVNPFAQHLANRAEIEKLLPHDVKMNSIVCYGPSWKQRRTVEEQLIVMYAHIGKDGKICDAKGEEIHFATVVSNTGSPREYKLTDKDNEELGKLTGRYESVVAVIIGPPVPIPASVAPRTS